MSSCETLAKCRTYDLNGITFVPHYREPGIFVGPAGRIATQQYLQQLKATPTTTFLWPRPWAQREQLQATT